MISFHNSESDVYGDHPLPAGAIHPSLDLHSCTFARRVPHDLERDSLSTPTYTLGCEIADKSVICFEVFCLYRGRYHENREIRLEVEFGELIIWT